MSLEYACILHQIDMLILYRGCKEKFALWQICDSFSICLESTPKFMKHCVKCFQIRSFFWSVFSRIWTECGKIWTRKNSVFGHFLRSEMFYFNFINLQKCCNFTQFPGVEILWKGTVYAWVIRPKLCRHCTFPQNFHTRRLGESMVFYAVLACENVL